MAQPHLIKDVIVVVPGIMGSTLHRNGTPIWEPSSGTLVEALRTWFGSIKKLKLPEGTMDGHPGDGVTAVDLMPDVRLPLGLWTFDIGYSELVDFLATSFHVNTDPELGPRNLLTFPYDWRLSNRYNGTELAGFANDALQEWRDQGGEFRDAQLVFICHSMGGLVARWYIDHLGGAEHTRALITLGTPHRGALNALDQLVNGIRKGPGPFKLDLTALGRSLPSIYQLAPEYACIDHEGTLKKIDEITVPEMSRPMIDDAIKFHTQIDKGRLANKDSYRFHPIGGYKQPTLTTARISGKKLKVFREIKGDDEQGDGTVPRLSFAPPDIAPDSEVLHYAADNHGGLVHNPSVFDQIEGILTGKRVTHRARPKQLSVEIPETLDPEEPLVVRASVATGGDAPLEVVVADESGHPVGREIRVLPTVDGPQAVPSLPGPGVYQVTVRGAGPTGATVSPITSIVLAWPREAELGLDRL